MFADIKKQIKVAEILDKDGVHYKKSQLAGEEWFAAGTV